MNQFCSIGDIVGEECHKTVDGSISKNLKELNCFSEIHKELFKRRVGNQVTTVCEYHEKKFILKYNHIYGKYCSDPLKYHKKPINKGLREIKIEHLPLIKIDNLGLVPGKSLCPNCYTKIFLFPSESTEHEFSECQDDYVPQTEVLEHVDLACSVLGVSPASKIRKLSDVKRPIAIDSKINKISETLKRNLELCFDKGPNTSNPDEVLEKTEVSRADYLDLITKLKEKCLISTKEDKVKIISLFPDSWSRQKICSEPKVSDRLVRLTRQLVKEQGILPVLGKKKGVGVCQETVEKIQAFFESDENSRMCPGKKDCTKVVVGGEKITKQKRLVLSNLNELYVAFKTAHPECKVGRSKFCELRPKWCILAGASGTHSVCVCVYHQNVKLMIDGAKLNVDYKDLLELLVCDINSYDCMLSLCNKCPGKQSIMDIFQESEEDMPDNIHFKQWMTTDRTILKPKEEYFESLIEKLENLKDHHYISKIQSKFLKEKKENLLDTECIVLADFAENFTFVVQDEIQGYHWVNDQATVHPFVVYSKDENGKTKSHSICILSDYLEHSTQVVHIFQSYVCNFIKENLLKVEKVIYFSDGSGSQYKNKKNFSNLCNHKRDFELDAEWHFFASCHGKNACDGIGGTTKREVSKASLQRTSSDQILSVEKMYEFCKENIKGITYFLVGKTDIMTHIEGLKTRFDNCVRVKGTRKYHKFCRVSENTIRCFVTSKSNIYEDHCICKIVPLTLKTNDLVTCIYDGEWWLAQIEQLSVENSDVYVHFYHPAGPRTTFRKSVSDKVWVPIINILRKLSSDELKTTTGRVYTISQKLCDEISILLNAHSH